MVGLTRFQKINFHKPGVLQRFAAKFRSKPSTTMPHLSSDARLRPNIDIPPRKGMEAILSMDAQEACGWPVKVVIRGSYDNFRMYHREAFHDYLARIVDAGLGNYVSTIKITSILDHYSSKLQLRSGTLNVSLKYLDDHYNMPRKIEALKARVAKSLLTD